jgi:hypothetical protein
MAAVDLKAARAKWRRSPVAFITEVLRDPETGRPFVLYPVQVRFLREGLTPTADGPLPFPELVFSGPKKSGKTASNRHGDLVRRDMPRRPIRRGLLRRRHHSTGPTSALLSFLLFLAGSENAGHRAMRRSWRPDL